MTKKTWLMGGMLVVAASTMPVVAAAQSPWLVRTTGIVIFTDAKSNALDLDVPDMTDLAVDVTYHFTDNVAVNVLATFLNPEVKSGSDSLGSVGLIPPIVTAQYVFNPASATRVYAGAGFNYNLFYDETGSLDAINAKVDDTVGLVAQLGLDHKLSDSVTLNVDLKFLQFKADVEVDGDKVDELDMDAFILGAGLGFWL